MANWLYAYQAQSQGYLESLDTSVSLEPVQLSLCEMNHVKRLARSQRYAIRVLSLSA